MIRISLLVLIGLILLFITCFFIIHIPSVQTKLTSQINHIVSKQINSTFEAKGVDLGFLKTLILKDIYIEDQQNDTLLFASKLSIDVSPLNLFWKEIYLNSIFLEGTNIHLSHSKQDSIANFQFLIDAFSSDSTSEDTTTSSFPFKLGVRKIKIKDFNFRMDYSASGFLLNTKWENFSILINELNLDSTRLNLHSILLDEAYIEFEKLLRDTTIVPNESELEKENNSITIVDIPWDVSISRLKLTNNTFSYSDREFPAADSGIDFSHIYLSPLNMEIENANLKDMSASLSVKELAFVENNSDYRLIGLSGDISADSQQVTLQNFLLNTPYSIIQNYSRLEYPDFEILLNKPESIRFFTQFDNSSIGLKEISFFAPKLAFDSLFLAQELNLKGNLQGSFNSVFGNNLEFSLGDSTELNGSFQISQNVKRDSTTFLLKLSSFSTQYEDLIKVIPNRVPENLRTLGQIDLTGVFEGNLYDIIGNVSIQTDIGSLFVNAVSYFDSNYEDATYKGIVRLEEFNIGQFVNSDSLGSLSFAAKVDGKGLTLDSLNADLEGEISSFSFNGYTYKDIFINGLYQKNKFSGEIDINDQHIAANFNGLVNIADSIPIFNFQANIDTIDLEPLNLYPSKLSLSGELITNFSGNNIDNIEGDASLSQVWISDSTYSYSEENIELSASENTSGEKHISLTSDIIHASLDGFYNIESLPELFNDFINKYFPLDELLGSTSDSTSLFSQPDSSNAFISENFSFSFSADRLTRLTQLFDPALEKLDTLAFEGNFNNQANELNLRLWIPDLIYQGISVDSIVLISEGDPSKLSFSTSAFQTSLNSSFSIKEIKLSGQLKDQQMSTNLYISGDTVKRKLMTGFTINQLKDDFFQVFLNDDFYLNDTSWQINPEHTILYNGNSWDLSKVSLSKSSQKLSIKHRTSQQNPWYISFENFRLKEITEFIRYKGYDLSGTLNGEVSINRNKNEQIVLIDLGVQDLILNEQQLGKLSLKADQNSSDGIINLSSQLVGAQNQFKGEGKYDAQNEEVYFLLKLEQLKLSVFEAIAPDQFSNSLGFLAGDLEISGSPKKPVVQGKLFFKDASAYLEYVQTQYSFPNEKISLSQNAITFDEFTMLDSLGNEAYLNGSIRHNYFDEFVFDLLFRTNSFQFINSERGVNPLFYGNITLGMVADFQGPLDELNVTATAKTMPNTNFTILQSSEQEEASLQENFIIYTNTLDTTVTDSFQTEIAYEIDNNGYNLDLTLEITPEAKFTYIVDPVSGDQVSARGSANLQVDFPENGDLQIFGSYTLEEGSYDFSFENVVKKQFSIQPGSRINFQGDVTSSRMDITAIYSLRTTTDELTDRQSSQSSSSKVRQEVQVLLNMKDKIFSPSLSFDIKIPSIEGGGISNPVGQELNRLRQNPSSLNKQVFGLLLFGSFISSESNTSLSTGLENAAVSSVSKLITQQLNRLADKYIQGVTINLNVDSYKNDLSDGDNARVSQLQLGVSKQLFNDRITVEVEGDLQVSDNESLNSDANFSGIAGNFVLKYRITEDGRYNIRVFRRNDQNSFINSSGGNGNSVRTGVGVSYQKSFK